MNTPQLQMTGSARNVLAKAEEEALAFNHSYIGTEHLLLGLTKSPGLAQIVLRNLGVHMVKVRAATEFIIGRGGSHVTGDIGLTPRAKVVLRLAADEMHRRGNAYLTTAHLLVGLVREGEGIAAGVLESIGAPLDRVRNEVSRILEEAKIEDALSSREIASFFALLDGISDEELVEKVRERVPLEIALQYFAQVAPGALEKIKSRPHLTAALEEHLRIRLYKILEAIDST